MIAKIFKILLSFLFITLVSFSIIRLIPGDPAQNIIGERGASEERLIEIRKNLGLDQPLLMQYGHFVLNALKGDFGDSISSKQPVIQEFKVLFPATFELAATALIWSSLLGIGLGIFAAIRRNTFIDYLIVSVSTVGFAMPVFWWGLVCIFVFAVQFMLFPVSGRIDVIFDIPYATGFYFIDAIIAGDGAAFLSACRHIVLPAFVLGTIPLALVTRVTRSAFIDISKEDFIRTARAKGLSSSQIIFKHIFKNALPQILTALGLSLGHLLTGAIMTETLFSWPGLGRWIVTSILARDYPVVQAGLFYSMVVVFAVNFTTDEFVKWVNPRLKESL